MSDVSLDNLKELLGDTHVRDVEVLMKILNWYHEAREEEYDRSFARRGMIGIWMNLARKYDAIDNMGKKQEFDTVKMVDHLVDVALYSLKMLDAISKISRTDGENSFRRWLKRVYCPATGFGFDELIMTIGMLEGMHDGEQSRKE